MIIPYIRKHLSNQGVCKDSAQKPSDFPFTMSFILILTQVISDISHFGSDLIHRKLCEHHEDSSSVSFIHCAIHSLQHKL
jgi:hypothetical protein